MMQLDDTSVSIANEEAANGTGIADDQRAEILSNYLRLQTTGIQPYGLSIREAGKKGLGVFASAPIKERAVIEFCHAILLGYRHRYTHDPALKQYAYWLNCNCKECKAHGVQGMIPLGFGSIYNSAESEQEANASHRMFAKERLIVFVAKRDIPAGEEILTWWGQKYFDSWCKPGKTDTGEATGLVAGLA
jgi:hypothetical protein